MRQFIRSHRLLVALGLIGLSSTNVLAARGGFHGGGFGGASHAPAFRAPAFHAGRVTGAFHLHAATFARQPIVRGPRLPPTFGRGPHIWPPIIVRGPRPGWPPIIIGHHRHFGPIIPSGGAILVGAATPVVGGIVQTTRVGVGCAVPGGTFVSVVFLPTATVADLTTFLKTYNVTMADGPDADGIYRVRLAETTLPANEIVRVVTSMRSQVANVRSVKS